MDLSIYEHSKRRWNVNYYNIPVTVFNLDDEGAHKFNQILQYAKSLNVRNIIRTPSGGISNRGVNNKYRCWDIKHFSTGAEITILLLEGCWRFQIRTKSKFSKKTRGGREKPIYGATALKEFKRLCSQFNINIDKYAVADGVEQKKQWKESVKTIYKKYIHPMSHNLVNKTLTTGDIHHIDLCSGFQSGLSRAFPEFKGVCQYLYDQRKNPDGSSNDSIKAIQVMSIGAMWSEHCGKAKYFPLAKGAIEENNRLLQELSQKLLSSGRQILMYNTDGIWYRGEIYHDETEKCDLGGWRNDHCNCERFRMKNNCTYEFVEDGRYTAVMSGSTTLDRVKAREDWEWGDIYKTAAIEYQLTDEGVCTAEGELL